MGRRVGLKLIKGAPTKRGAADYQLPGVGEGLVDPDFDKLGEAEMDGIVSGVGAHSGRTEDYE